VGLAAGAPVVLAGVGQLVAAAAVLGPRGVAQRVTAGNLLGQDAEAHALQPAGAAGEAAVDHFGFEAQDLEDLRALVAGQRADTHLGHDLADALAHAVDVGRHDLVVGQLRVDHRGVAQAEERLVGEVGVNRVGAVARQRAEVVHLADLARLDDEPNTGAGAGPHQVVVHGPGGQQRRHGDAARAHAAVAEDDEFFACGDGGGGLLAQRFNGGGERRGGHTICLAVEPGQVGLVIGQVQGAAGPARRAGGRWWSPTT